MAQQELILKKGKYKSVNDAQIAYQQFVLTELSKIIFKKEWLGEDGDWNAFEYWIKKLICFQNPVQMKVWHNKDIVIRNEQGEESATTWDNMCNFSRLFVCAEMYQCIEILKRATPNEVWDKEEANKIKLEEIKSIHESILIYFNDFAYPKLESLAKKIQTVLDEVEEQIGKPERDKINAELKVNMQVKIGDDVEFIKGKERRM